MRLHTNIVSSQVNTLFEKIIPERIKCVSNKQYHLAEILPKQKALQHDYIHVNPINSVNIITLDIDKDTDPFDLSPLPNMAVYNKTNCKAHVQYFLETPVHANENSSKTAKAFYNAVHRGLIKHLGADPAYNHTFTKNPFSDKFRSYPLHDRLWSLEHLTEYVKPVNKTIIKPSEAVALGRNCYIFETVAKWSYIAIREYKDIGYTQFHHAVLFRCHELNMSIFAPLDNTEVKSIAKSISKWSWNKRFDLTSYTKQSYRGKQSGKRRNENMLINKQKALDLLGKGLKVEEIAKALEVGVSTVYRYLGA